MWIFNSFLNQQHHLLKMNWVCANNHSVYKLVYNNIKNQDYKFEYKFIVIDKYNQVYLFDVSDKTLNNWSISLIEILDIADYHYSNNNYKLPYKLLTSKIVLWKKCIQNIFKKVKYFCIHY